MESGFIALGILSVLYYSFIVWYTKRLNSTFSWFWIAFAILNIGLGVLVYAVPDWIDRIVLTVAVLFWLIFFAVEVLVLCAMVSMPQKKAKYIIILGAQIRGKEITGSLKRRLDKGLLYLQRNPETVCIVSGGKGKGEAISEAEAMADYLKKKGVDETRILMEDKSTTTLENLMFCRLVVDDIEKDKIGIISNNFHIYRAMKMAKRIGYKKIFAIPASTNMILFPNYMVREFFAVFVMYLELQNVNKK